MAEKLGVSRQTISKWESDETLPDIRQSKKLSLIYHVTLDELISFDMDVEEIKTAIQQVGDEVTEKVDWTKVWSEKYPILARYQQEVSLPYYQEQLTILLNHLKQDYHYNDLDAFLVLKDILGGLWKNQ